MKMPVTVMQIESFFSYKIVFQPLFWNVIVSLKCQSSTFTVSPVLKVIAPCGLFLIIFFGRSSDVCIRSFRLGMPLFLPSPSRQSSHKTLLSRHCLAGNPTSTAGCQTASPVSFLASQPTCFSLLFSMFSLSLLSIAVSLSSALTLSHCHPATCRSILLLTFTLINSGVIGWPSWSHFTWGRIIVMTIMTVMTVINFGTLGTLITLIMILITNNN